MESEMKEEKMPSSPRRVGIILGILILLLPHFFVWLLLRRGHTRKARLIGFGWLAFWIIVSILVPKSANRDVVNAPTPAAPAVATAPTPAPVAAVPAVVATAPAAPAAPAADAVKSYTAMQVSSSYGENSVAADMLFRDKRVKVTGRITDINTDFMGNPYLILAGSNQFMGPQFKFNKSALSAIAALKKGAQISVICTGRGDLAKIPMFENCEL
ncbi:hypothetical protein BZK31_27830 [Pseudomonas floridensis]|uniref:tRNA_anti-like n=2 Tax=Pseudomonas floridensis TaxID=1958950 RepID=A0A1X0MSA3_9PSED|nr:hypothetical protein BZK31_27830 [Pseudomonas floridensis]